MKVLYLASPYRAKDEWGIWMNIMSAHMTAKGLWNKGYAVISPVSNTAWMGEIGDFKKWMTGDLEILGRCDGLVLNYGWEKSEGCRMEYGHARMLGIKIYNSPEEVPNENDVA